MTRFPINVILALASTMVFVQIGLANPSDDERQTIVVVRMDIDVGEPLTAESVKLEEWPGDKVPEEALQYVHDVEDRRTRTRLFAGEPVLDQKLFPHGVEGMTPSEQIPFGYRVVSVNVRLSGSAEMVAPGDRVDVLVYTRGEPADTNSRPGVRVILRDIRVFAMNQVFEPATPVPHTDADEATVSLLVKPTHGQRLMLAAELGKIGLMVRNPRDYE